MPYGDGTGPRGQGGRGRMGGRGLGPSGYCICPKCGTRVPQNKNFFIRNFFIK